MNNQFGIIIQARTSSKRLFGKVLSKIANKTIMPNKKDTYHHHQRHDTPTNHIIDTNTKNNGPVLV